jgi:hypothetical protein
VKIEKVKKKVKSENEVVGEDKAILSQLLEMPRH